jgi:hypothetical protein
VLSLTHGIPHGSYHQETQIADVGERTTAEQKLVPVRDATHLAVQTINSVLNKCAYKFVKLCDLCVTLTEPWTTIVQSVW